MTACMTGVVMQQNFAYTYSYYKYKSMAHDYFFAIIHLKGSYIPGIWGISRPFMR